MRREKDGRRRGREGEGEEKYRKRTGLGPLLSIQGISANTSHINGRITE